MLAPLLVPALAAVLPSLVTADSHLVSKQHGYSRSATTRLGKRYFDDSGNYNLTFIHINDVHAHLDEFVASGTDCVAGKPCYGGYARIKSKADELRDQYPDSLFFNAGDEFQGTLFYTYDGPKVIADTLNQIGFDAMTLGNHEFDGGEQPLVDFIQNLTFPVVCANIKSTNQALQTKLAPYQIFPEHNLALVAVTTADIPQLSKPGPGTEFADPIATVQSTVDYVLANEKDVSRIVVMTHIGYDLDRQLAKNTRNVQLIIGSHSHTLLGNFPDAKGPYPTIETNLDGDEVFIVTAFKWGQYLGKIDVAYNQRGKIVAYTGAPILMDNSTEKDWDLQEQITEYRKPFENLARTPVGWASAPLDSTTCQTLECTMGNAVCDAMVEYRRNSSAHVDGALVNSGGIRAAIDAGQVTRGQVLTTFPFLNAVVDVTLTGQQWWDMFEAIVSKRTSTGVIPTSFVQVSHDISFTYNPNNSQGSRLISLNVGQNGIDRNRNYTFAVPDYVAGGGDNFLPRQNAIALDTMDVVMANYIGYHSPLAVRTEGRIQTTDRTSGGARKASSGSFVAVVGVTVVLALAILF